MVCQISNSAFLLQPAKRRNICSELLKGTISFLEEAKLYHSFTFQRKFSIESISRWNLFIYFYILDPFSSQGLHIRLNDLMHIFFFLTNVCHLFHYGLQNFEYVTVEIIIEAVLFPFFLTLLPCFVGYGERSNVGVFCSQLKQNCGKLFRLEYSISLSRC